MLTEDPNRKNGELAVSIPNPPPEELPPPVDETKTNVFSVLREAPEKIGEMDLESKGYIDDRSEQDYDGSLEWLENHTAKTPKRSLIVGTFHNTDQTATDEIKKYILPRVMEGATELLKTGKPMVFLAEGATHGVDGTEQEMIANELDKLSGGKIKHDTWDDKNVEIYGYDDKRENKWIDFNLPIVKKLSAKFGEAKIVEAGIYAVMHGQDDELPVSNEARQYLENMGIDSTDKKALYRAAFPNDNHDEDTIISKVCREYNRLRQENMLRKIKDIEESGGVVIVTPGASHAYSLKNILEKGLY